MFHLPVTESLSLQESAERIDANQTGQLLEDIVAMCMMVSKGVDVLVVEGLHADDYEIWERELREQAERDRFDGELRSLGALGDGESIFGRQPGNGPSSPDGDDGVSDS